MGVPVKIMMPSKMELIMEMIKFLARLLEVLNLINVLSKSMF